MAIKVNGTTVINDSRALSNIASVDATTAAAIGNAGVGGVITTTINSANAFSRTGPSTYGFNDTGIISNSKPSSSIVYASRTVPSGAVLASVTTSSASSGITVYQNNYFGVTLGIAHWDNSASTLTLLGRAWPNDDLSGSANGALEYIQGKAISSGVIAVNQNDILYGIILSTYTSTGYTGGASWSAGTVTTTFLEVS